MARKNGDNEHYTTNKTAIVAALKSGKPKYRIHDESGASYALISKLEWKHKNSWKCTIAATYH